MEQIKEYEYVDLGLPSGLKWAKCNLGAETETDYGDYFMWGSIKPNSNTFCNWENAPFNGGSSHYDETYFNSVKDTICPNGVLRKEFDAAFYVTGGKARMPTLDELQELLENTENEWIEDFNGSGVNGRKFTSKTNGNSIFIPASGARSESSFYGQGIYSYIWSSSLYTLDPRNAWLWNLGSGYVGADDYGYRYYGFCVRSVLK